VRINDAVWGALLLLFSAVLLVHVQGFPKIPGQQVGPALFPGFLAVGLAVCGVLLVIKGLATRRAWGERAEWFAFAEWTRSRKHVVAFAMTLGVNVLYILAVDRLRPARRDLSGPLVLGLRRAGEMDRAAGHRDDARHSLRLLQVAEGTAAVGPAAGDRVVTAATGERSR
jgi:hypothetical protein